jgi:hypothetical protein|tara:strand:+ start:63 stop:263 length:201 start_codon:yes stop_codon:yes gene_type:complete
MAKEEFRYYMNRKKVVHRRAKSWFDAHSEGEKVYSESFTRVKGIDDLTPYESPKPKPKAKAKKSKK